MMRSIILRLARAIGLFKLSRFLTRKQLRILAYHGIWIGSEPHFGDCLFMSAKRFERRMEMLSQSGYQIISLAEGYRRLKNRSLRSGDIVITIDDAWYGSYLHMLPVLEKFHFPATLYVTTYYVLACKPVINVLIQYMFSRGFYQDNVCSDDTLFKDLLRKKIDKEDIVEQVITYIDALPTLQERYDITVRISHLLNIDIEKLLAQGCFMLMNSEQIREAHAAGIDIQLHTHTHRVHDFDSDLFRREIYLNKQHLCTILGCSPDVFSHFCYPSGMYEKTIFNDLSDAGIETATTTEFGLNRRDTDPLALKRILDSESMSDHEFEAKISGFWSSLKEISNKFYNWRYTD